MENEFKYYSPIGVTIENIQFKYDKSILFRDFSINFPPNINTSILGNNGIGKSTLIKLISGIEKPNCGKITDYNNNTINDSIAYMDQFDQLLPWLKVKNNIILGFKLRQENYSHQKFNYLTNILGIEKFLNNFPTEVSGGTKQRIALARTFIEDKPLVIMDEPFNSLDTNTKNKLIKLTKDLVKNKTMILVTHDIMEAIELSDQIVILKGKPAQVYKVFNSDDLSYFKKKDNTIIELYKKILNILDM
ncbi:MAG: Aliphatic sulfonates import ATP-binding protein SsuB [Alphaproteobacteria bacterium MarineAlpha2_Bin1]|nr:MAG: Aliphatic sulfonates import ATP-binding protein SsuB [Alphaproteobacteria bacterium MarineAlpha2_Bin1]